MASGVTQDIIKFHSWSRTIMIRVILTNDAPWVTRERGGG